MNQNCHQTFDHSIYRAANRPNLELVKENKEALFGCKQAQTSAARKNELAQKMA